MKKIIFRETTTIGIRYHFEDRIELERENIEIETQYGRMKAKKVITEGEVYIYPEYESAKKLAEENNIPLKHFWQF